MFLTSLCRAYGAQHSIYTLPTALPWANLPVRLTARGASSCAQWHCPEWVSMLRNPVPRLRRSQFMHTLPTALPWANLPVRLTARGASSCAQWHCPEWYPCFASLCRAYGAHNLCTRYPRRCRGLTCRCASGAWSTEMKAGGAVL